MPSKWSDIPNPLEAAIRPPANVETANELDGDIEVAAGAQLDRIVILGDNGQKIPAIIDQATRTVYPVRQSS